MRRYEQVLEMIEKLEVEDIKLELAIDDAVDTFHKAKDIYTQNQTDEYLKKLREQRRECFVRAKNLTKSLNFYGEDKDNYLAFITADGLMVKTYITTEDLPRFTLWLMMMNEEIK